MTAQRNENSVLFSLNNLATLATDTTKSGPSNAGFATSGGSEGSGLIDIRAMAAMTLGAKKDDGESGTEDDGSDGAGDES